jgi:hypothetical protein
MLPGRSARITVERPMRRFTQALFFLLLTLALGCGGSTKPAESGPAHEMSTEREQGHAPRAAAGDDEPGPAPAAKRGACDDGTCSPCGDAVCPNGWYCDESAPGGPACGWLPECAQKAGCGCIKKALAGCACEEKSGAAHLTCKSEKN